MNVDTETKSFNLTKKDVRALAAFAAKPAGTAALHVACIRFECNGTRGADVIATDGHAIVHVSLRPAFARNSFSVPVEEFERSAKSLSLKDELNVSGGEGSARQVFLTAGVSGCARRVFEPPGEYPKWRGVIPSHSNSNKLPVERGFDSRLLARLALVQAASGANGGAFSYHADDFALKVVFKGEGTTWTVVVMEMSL